MSQTSSEEAFKTMAQAQEIMKKLTEIITNKERVKNELPNCAGIAATILATQLLAKSEPVGPQDLLGMFIGGWMLRGMVEKEEAVL